VRPFPLLLAGVLTLGMATVAAAQDAQAEPGGAGLTPPEVLRLLDAYAIVQAQDQLSLDDKQYPLFVERFKHLQEVRRRHLVARARVVQTLRRLSAPQPPPDADEAALRRGLESLRDQERTGREDVERALAAVDQVLTLRQQVRFRVFEDQMERRKLDLLSRARQGARGGARRPASR
jgi:hypothetical protein